MTVVKIEKQKEENSDSKEENLNLKIMTIFNK